MAAVTAETLRIRDGSTMEVTRIPDVDDSTWADVKAYVEGNVETATALRELAKNSDAMRGWLQTQAIVEHYSAKLASGDRFVLDRMNLMEEDPELAPVVDDVRRNGLEAAMKHFHNEDLMLKFNRIMGGVPDELKGVLKRIDERSLTIHEAAKSGDLAAVQGFLGRKQSVDTMDHRGVTALGYAVGADRPSAVKLLLESRADQYNIDKNHNSALHFAAGYGRTDLVEYLLNSRAVVNERNAQGQTPLSVAKLNKHDAAIQILKAYGAS
uniref:Ankyrin repeat domain-containing protein n=1 Tax=Alexandrium andersonii TaxID=327968 RepID=A0A7S2F2E2_9DINO